MHSSENCSMGIRNQLPTMGYFVESDPVYSSDEEEEEIEEELPTDGLMNIWSAVQAYAELNPPLLDRCSYAEFMGHVENADTLRPMKSLREYDSSGSELTVRKMCKDEWMEFRAKDINYLAMLLRKYSLIVDDTFPDFVFNHTSGGYLLV